MAPSSAAPRGIALVLLHGLASNLTRWSEFVEHSALRGWHDLIRIDLRGHGVSDGGGTIGSATEAWVVQSVRRQAEQAGIGMPAVGV